MMSVFDFVVPLFSCKDIFKTQNFAVCCYTVPTSLSYIVSTYTGANNIETLKPIVQGRNCLIGLGGAEAPP